MPKCRLLHCAVVVMSLSAGASLLAASGPRGTDQQPQPQPTFRTGITAVPIDIRVIDRDGKPVTGLTQGDFTVFEDDVRQQLVHFSQQVLEARLPGPAMRARPDVPSFDGSPQHHRIFLVVVGPGAFGSRPLGAGTRTVADPSDALGGLLRLARTRLLPQDQVALLAYNRATDFSADHEGFATMLEAFRKSEEDGLAALTRRSSQAPVMSPAASVFATEPATPVSPAEAELGFAEYVTARNRPGSEGENVYCGIKYLRFMEGEKHLIYVTAHGVRPPTPATLESAQMDPWDDPKRLAAAANDARVALHVIQTGGIPASPLPFLAPLPIMTPKILLPGLAYFGMGSSGATGSTETTGGSRAAPQPGWDRPAPSPGVPMPGVDADGFLALANLRMLARLTGGHASIMADAGPAVDRIDTQTRADYLLAYYPSNPVWDGRYRAIRVEVSRPDVTVLFRHGYHAEQQVSALTRRTVVADGRLIAAAMSTRQYRDLRISATPIFTKSRTGKGGEMLVRLVIDASRIVWASDDLARRVAHLDLAIYCGDAREKTVGQTRRMVNVALTEESHALVTKQGLPYTVRVPLVATPRFLKIVVYNIDSDLVGSTVVTMK